MRRREDASWLGWTGLEDKAYRRSAICYLYLAAMHVICLSGALGMTIRRHLLRESACDDKRSHRL
jgi:hypothetical protein